MKKCGNSSQNQNHSQSAGLSLVELLVVLLVMSVALSTGLPLMGKLGVATQVESASRQLLGAINYARHEAIMRNTSVSLCPSRLWQTGEVKCAGSFADGWIVFANRNRDAVVDEPEDTVLRIFSEMPAGYRVMNRKGTTPVGGVINYLPDGTAHRNLTLQLCPPDQWKVPSLSIVLNIVGRARLEREWGQCLRSA